MKKISRPQPALPSSPVVRGSLASSTGSMAAVSSPIRHEVYYEDAAAAVPAQYPGRMSLYLRNPDYEITIEDFEELALARLERNYILRQEFQCVIYILRLCFMIMFYNYVS